MFTSAKKFGISVGLLVLASLTPFHFAEAAEMIGGAPTFFDVPPELGTVKPHDEVQLNSLYTRGVGPFTPAMEGKIYRYPLPKGGVLGAEQYNGCYDRKNRRLKDLDNDNTCNTAITDNPGKSIYRLFMGYKISCPGTINAAGNCTDAQLIMNCAFEQVKAGDGAFDSAAATTRNCSNEKGIVRHALGTSNPAPLSMCYAGQDGSDPTCPSCAVNFYNDSVSGANTTACKPCPSRSVTGATVTSVNLITDNVGAISEAQCRVSDTALTCLPNFALSSDKQTCNPSASACSLKLALNPKNPTLAASDGEIAATYSGETAPVVSIPTISAPSLRTAASGNGSTSSPAIFTGLGANTYTVSVTDSACTQNVSLTLSPVTPPASPTPCRLTLNLTGVNPTTSGGNDGSIAGNIGGATGSVSVLVGSSYVVAPSTPPVSGGNAMMSATGLPQGFYSVTVSDSAGCSVNKGINLSAPSAPACTLAISQNASTNPTSGSNGSFGIGITGFTTPLKVEFTNPPTGYSGPTSTNLPTGPVYPSTLNFTYPNLPAGTWTITASDPTCSKTFYANLIASAPTRLCDWTLFDQNGDPVTQSSTTVGTTGYAFDSFDSSSVGTTRGTTNSMCMSPPSGRTCYKKTRATASCAGSGVTDGGWILSSQLNTAENGDNLTIVAPGATPLFSSAGPTYVVPIPYMVRSDSTANGEGEHRQMYVYLWRKKSDGGAACTKADGLTTGSVSVYEVQQKFAYCPATACADPSGDCTGCVFYDIGDPTPTGKLSSTEKQRCESAAPTPTPKCDFGLYDEAGALVSKSSVSVGTLGYAFDYVPGPMSSGTVRTLNGACVNAYSFFSGSYSCGNSVKNTTLNCATPSGYGYWNVASTAGGSTMGSNLVVAYTQTLTMRGNSSVIHGTVNIPQIISFGRAVPGGSTGSNGNLKIYLWKKLSGGGAACVQANGSPGTTSTYAYELFVDNCGPTDCSSGACRGCPMADPATISLPGTVNTSTGTRCE